MLSLLVELVCTHRCCIHWKLSFYFFHDVLTYHTQNTLHKLYIAEISTYNLQNTVFRNPGKPMKQSLNTRTTLNIWFRNHCCISVFPLKMSQITGSYKTMKSMHACTCTAKMHKRIMFMFYVPPKIQPLIQCKTYISCKHTYCFWFMHVHFNWLNYLRSICTKSK